MIHVALLRGINVGGNTLIKMAALKAATERAGYTDVRTYIASGNIVFASDKKDTGKIESDLEQVIRREFALPVRVVVLTGKQFKEVLEDVPKGWKTRSDIRRYIAFLKPPVTPDDVMREMQPKEGIDFIVPGKRVVYMATLMSGLTKSGINKVIGKKIYRDMTMRNYTTVKKIQDMCETE